MLACHELEEIFPQLFAIAEELICRLVFRWERNFGRDFPLDSVGRADECSPEEPSYEKACKYLANDIRYLK